MGRVALGSLSDWESKQYPFLKKEINSSGNIVSVIFGGLPIFRDGAIRVYGRANYSFIGARLPKTAYTNAVWIDSCHGFSQGYTFGVRFDYSGSASKFIIARNTTALASKLVPSQTSAFLVFQCNGHQLTGIAYNTSTGLNIQFQATDSTYAAGHIGIPSGSLSQLCVDFGGFNPVYPTTNIAYLKYRVLRNGNPVQGAEVVAVHHKMEEMMTPNTAGYPCPLIPKIGIARGVTGPDGWVEIPLDTDDGPWMISVRYPDGNLWYTAESKPGRMPVLYS